MAYLWEKHMFDKNSTIEISDPAVWEIIQKEGKRQEDPDDTDLVLQCVSGAHHDA